MSRAQGNTESGTRSEERLTLPEAAQFLGVSPRTLQRLLEQGAVRGGKVGRQWRFREADLEAYLNREAGAPLELETTYALSILASLQRMRSGGGGAPADAETSDVAQGDVSPTERIARELIHLAIDAGASDLHIEPTEKNTRIRMRLDGVLHELVQLPASVHDAIVGRLKQMAEMNVAERRMPQDGRIGLHYGEKEWELRLNVSPVFHGEKAVLRILPRQVLDLVWGLNRLGLLPRTMAQLENLYSRPQGLLIVTGPTGAGKTTLLYSILNRLNTVERNLLTVEDPVELLIPGISQMAVNARLGLRFPELLRSAFRQDPDILMCGEIRDLETAELLLQAAVTGHMVLSVLHTESAVGALLRLTDMGAAPFMVASQVIGVVGVRLARRLCDACKRPTPADPTLLYRIEPLPSASGWPIKGELGFYQPGRWPIPENAAFHEPVGCDQCRRTGYRGRIGLFEVLEVSAVKKALLRGASEDELTALAVEQGMEPLLADGLAKAAQGITSLEEVLRVLSL